jgi:hypothetical protein
MEYNSFSSLSSRSLSSTSIPEISASIWYQHVDSHIGKGAGCDSLELYLGLLAFLEQLSLQQNKVLPHLVTFSE